MGDKIRMELKEAVRLFEKENGLSDAKERENKANDLRKKFVEDFPKEALGKMTLDDYVIAKQGYGNPDSFCYRIKYELKHIAHMGNVYQGVFGIYCYGNNKELKLYKTFVNKFGDDMDEAFVHIKREIVHLLDEIEKKNFDYADKCELNSSFVYMLLAIYYPNVFIPICTKPTLEESLENIGIIGDDRGMVYKNLQLVEWKNACAEVSEWSNSVMMSFCLWLNEKEKKQQIDKIDKAINDCPEIGISKEAIVKIRVNQSRFRKKLIERYHKCCLCGVQEESLLVASHIKPWSECDGDEKLDVNNGLLLCPNHDQLFDQGWISFDNKGNIRISPLLRAEDIVKLNVGRNMKIKVYPKNKKYLSYHRKNIFRT